jgi:hypothetical protein
MSAPSSDIEKRVDSHNRRRTNAIVSEKLAGSFRYQAARRTGIAAVDNSARAITVISE